MAWLSPVSHSMPEVQLYPMVGRLPSRFYNRCYPCCYARCHPAAIMLLFLPRSILDILIHSCCYSAAIASLMCRVASVRPCRIRITPKSWNCKWPQVKLRSELTISEQCSENISHKHALSYKKQRPAAAPSIVFINFP